MGRSPVILKAKLLAAGLALAVSPALADDPLACVNKLNRSMKSTAEYQKFARDTFARDYTIITQMDTDLDRNFQDASKVTVSAADIKRIVDDFMAIHDRAVALIQEHNDNVRDGCAKPDKVYDEAVGRSMIQIEEGLAAAKRVLAYKTAAGQQ
jgi:hypothetical protein